MQKPMAAGATQTPETEAAVRRSHEARIRALPLWQGAVDIAPLTGGLTNTNYLTRAAGAEFVVRIGADIPMHGIMRFNELAASLAAAAAGISPKVIHAGPGILVLEKIEGRTLTAEDVRNDLARVTDLLKRVHRDAGKFLRGPVLAFNVFHVIRDYAHRLSGEHSRSILGPPCLPDLPRLQKLAAQLEAAIGPDECVFCHNDLLPANFIADERRLWLIDWDYAGFGSPLFDLGGLASNSGLDADQRCWLIEDYFGRTLTDALARQVSAMSAASLLREALWSLVQETHSTLAFDYPAYTAENLARFEAAYAEFAAMEF